MVLDFNAENFFNGRFDVLNPWITEFDQFTRIGEHNVIVLLGTVRFFELGNVLSELMFAHKVTRKKKFDGIVQRRAGYAVILVFHFNVEGLDIEMPVIIVNLRQNSKALRRFPVAILLQIR